MKQVTDTKIETIITLLKVFTTCIADIVGKIIKLEMRSAPINLIPSTTTIEQRIANIALYKLVLIPIDLANSSSNVKAKILL